MQRPLARDYTRGSLGRNLLLLSVPMSADQLVSGFYHLVDLFFLGHLERNNAVLAAVGVGGVITFMLFSVGMGVGVAGVAFVARRIGQHDPEAASQALWHTLLLAFAVGLTVGGIGVASAPALLRLLGAEPAVVAVGSPYLRTLYAMFLILLPTHVTNGVLRGAGEPGTALRMTLIVHGVAIVLSPILIFVVGLGMPGSPLGLGTGCLVGWLWAIRKLRGGALRIRLGRFRPDLDLTRRIVLVGLPSSAQMLLRSTSRLVLMPLINQFGPSAAAAYGIAIRVMMLPIGTSFGVASAAATLVGQNLGAQQPERAARSAWLAGGVCSGMLLLAAAAIMIWAEPLVALLTEGSAIMVSAGAPAVRIMTVGLVFSGLGVVMGRSLDGAGNTVPPMLINLTTLWVVQIPLAYALPHLLGLAENGIWLGVASANIVNALLMAYWFSRGGWKRKVL